MGEERAALPDTIAVQRRQAPGDTEAGAPGFGHLTQIRCAPSVGSQGMRHILQPCSASVHRPNFNQHFHPLGQFRMKLSSCPTAAVHLI